MMQVDTGTTLATNVGTTVIKHHDKWRGDYYLREDLTFTPHKDQAARFYLLKAGNTGIINGDRISINCGNKVLVVTNENEVRLIDRDQIRREVRTFTLSDGTDNVTPITHETPLYIISDRKAALALRYYWRMEPPILTPGFDTQVIWPANAPNLINQELVGPESPDVRSFTFAFEGANAPIISETQICINEPDAKSKWWEWFESVRGPLFIFLLLVILVLIILTTQ